MPLALQTRPRQTVISPDLSTAYHDAIAIVEASYQEASTSISEYWWALYRIKRDNLWRAKYEDGQFKEWLADLRREPFGPSRSDFYMVMGTIDRLKKIGLTNREIKHKLGSLTTALKGDLKELFDKHGKGELLPEVAARLQEDGETLPELIDRLDTLGPGEARTQMKRLTTREHIFFTDDDWEYDETLGRLLVNVRWESDDDGLIYTGTVVITCTETTKPKKFRGKPPSYLPEKIAQNIQSRFGLSAQ